MACCPPGSAPYLAATYEAKGLVEDVGGVELYVSPVRAGTTPTSACLLLPDVFGWNGGRVRAIADGLAEQGYLVATAKLLSPPADGGTDGDGMSPTSKFNLDWVRQFPWSTQRPKVAAAVTYLTQTRGCSKVGVVGFCYGGHPACWISNENPDVIAAGVILHPSVQLETNAWGGDTEALLSSVKCPFLLAPAGNDLPTWDPTGPFASALFRSARGSECAFDLYEKMSHGWSVRGDVANPEVAQEVERVMKATADFLGKHLL